MYEQVFQFQQRPFSLTPFAKDYCPIGSMEESRLTICQAVERNNGPVLVVAEAGLGKSMLLTKLKEQFDENYKSVLLNCSKWTQRSELLKSIMFELRLPYKQLDEGELRLALIDYVQPGGASQEGLVLLLDDAHNLHPRIIDELSLMNNIVRDGQTRIYLVLAGQFRVEEILAHPKLASVNQRIAARCYLSEFDCEQTQQYIAEHVESAGRQCHEIFDPESIVAVFEKTGGVPRLINQLCDAVLLRAAADGIVTIDEGLVEAVWSEIHQLPTTGISTQHQAVSIEFGSLTSDAKDHDVDFPSDQSSEDFVDNLTEEIIEVVDHLEEQTPPVQSELSPGIGLEDSPHDQDAPQNAHDNSPESSFEPDQTDQEVLVPIQAQPAFQIDNPFGSEFDSVEDVDDDYAQMTSELNQKAAAVMPSEIQTLIDGTADLEQVQMEMRDSQVESGGEAQVDEAAIDTVSDSESQKLTPTKRDEPVPTREILEAQFGSTIPTGNEEFEPSGDEELQQELPVSNYDENSTEPKTTDTGWSETDLLREIYQQQSAMAQQLDATLNVSVNTDESSSVYELDANNQNEEQNSKANDHAGIVPVNPNEEKRDESGIDRIETQLTGGVDDDRDLIIMSQESLPPPRHDNKKDPSGDSEINAVPSKGRAKRVDYETLFAHLRSGQ